MNYMPPGLSLCHSSTPRRHESSRQPAAAFADALADEEAFLLLSRFRNGLGQAQRRRLQHSLGRTLQEPEARSEARSEHIFRSEARWRLGDDRPRSEALPSLGGASVRSRMVGSGAISLISGGSMKHVVVDVAEEGGIHQIRGRYGEIQRFSSRFSSFVC